MKMPRFIRLQQEKDGGWETIETFEVIPKLAQGPQAKRFFITERQLRELKTILENYEDAPKEINEAGKEEYEAEGGDDWGDITDAIDSYMCEPNRELRFLIEDIEAQEEPGHAALEIIAGRMAAHISASRNSSIYDLCPFNLFGEDLAVAAIFLPHLVPIRWAELWEKALKAEREKDGGACDVIIKALEGKE